MKTLTVTWLDGTDEEFRCQSWHAKDGILSLYSPNNISTPTRHLVLANMKSWAVEQ